MRTGGFAGGAAGFVGNRAANKVCFAGEVPIRTTTSHVRADAVLAWMRLLSRDEFDPDGAVVEEVFVREGLICRLWVQGRLIRTTSEHPFWVWGTGWTPVNQIRAGGLIWTEGAGGFGWARPRTTAIRGIQHSAFPTPPACHLFWNNTSIGVPVFTREGRFCGSRISLAGSTPSAS